MFEILVLFKGNHRWQQKSFKSTHKGRYDQNPFYLHWFPMAVWKLRQFSSPRMIKIAVFSHLNFSKLFNVLVFLSVKSFLTEAEIRFCREHPKKTKHAFVSLEREGGARGTSSQFIGRHRSHDTRGEPGIGCQIRHEILKDAYIRDTVFDSSCLVQVN